MDASLNEAFFDEDPALSRIISVMGNERCKDSLTELLDMPFPIFFQLEMLLYHASLREEERMHNRIQSQTR
ncbi:hypothetical protein Arno162_88 [Pectobacterium phage Arno162]|uniref:Uncharacterized protein n=2 Tax=Arnovirus TaxID=3425109 RepID=A0A679A2T6_9CAUD|nr:hypothetical protein Arno162_88 [Pectobacterium phage Arno162]AZV02275.1 hypothetical protein Arno18_89 [Pectobacterium phage Arno18]